MAGNTTPDGTTPKRFLSPKEFSEFSGLSLATIHRYLRNGKLPYRQPAGPRGRILIPAEGLTITAISDAPAQQVEATGPTLLPHAQTTTRLSPLSGPRPKWTRQSNQTQTKEM
jgi:predicted DNA-binding transcriptional regulator AlpA